MEVSAFLELKVIRSRFY